LNPKITHIAGLLRQRDELVARIHRIDQEIERSWQGRIPRPQKRRGAPEKYTEKDKKRVLALGHKGMTERKIAQITGIPHSTVGRFIMLGKLRYRAVVVSDELKSK